MAVNETYFDKPLAAALSAGLGCLVNFGYGSDWHSLHLGGHFLFWLFDFSGCHYQRTRGSVAPIPAADVFEASVAAASIVRP